VALHRTPEERRVIAEKFWASGLAKRDFSRQVGLHPETLRGILDSFPDLIPPERRFKQATEATDSPLDDPRGLLKPTPPPPDTGDLKTFSGPDYEGVEWDVYRLPRPGDSGYTMLNPVQGAWCLRFVGPLDLYELKRAVGGGRYRLHYVVRDKHQDAYVELAGEPIEDPMPAPMAAMNGAAGSGGPLDELRAKVDWLIEQQQQPKAQGSDLDNFLKALQIARELQPPPAPVGLLDPLVNIFTKGFELGTRAEGGGAETGPWSVFKEALPLLREVLGQRPTPPAQGEPALQPATAPPFPALAGNGRPAAPPQLAARPPATSGPPPATPALLPPNVIEMLARAIASNTDVVDLCDAAEVVLEPAALERLKGMSTEALHKYLAPLHQVFRHPRARAYLDSCLNELRNPTPEPEAEEETAGTTP
jgi:hypothetical protein